MNQKEKLDHFYSLISCCYNLYTWRYDINLNIIESNCPNEFLFDEFFTLSGAKSYLLSYMQTNQKPILLSDTLGFVWIAVIERRDDVIAQIHIMGPVFTSDNSLSKIEQDLSKYSLAVSTKKTLITTLQKLPTISATTFFQYAIMLHFCVNEEKIGNTDIEYQIRERPNNSGKSYSHNSFLSNPTEEKHYGTWVAESELFKMVQEGNLNYKAAIEKARKTSFGVKVNTNDSMGQAKISVIVFTALCTRYAIQGGLNPSLAYSVGDYYTQSVENCKTISDIAIVSHTMYDDFIHRVHKFKAASSNLSNTIQQCCDYIEINIFNKFELSDMASNLGYTEYYLSRKFKKEIGISINDYIRNLKIEKAKVLLASTHESIQKISDSLHFCSRSYFTEVFQKVTNTSPHEYRLANTKF
ncbi:MAG: AraC family transcriptional regulator [Herbinix sp.]|jgi:AraC-like DNA-binding protein|nr:AraC family transcriptional regulator [Herbinix sp.]MDF2540157.1 AraC family transcriptional regulator [Herbinix sp.]